MTVEIPFHNRRVILQMWAMMVGRVPLLLMDSNRDDNDPIDRWITTHLYGGDRDTGGRDRFRARRSRRLPGVRDDPGLG